MNSSRETKAVLAIQHQFSRGFQIHNENSIVIVRFNETSIDLHL